MDVIGLLSEEEMDRETTHQFVLYKLLEESDFARVLLGFPKTERVTKEPERRLFDLSVTGNGRTVFMKIKVRSPLTDRQLQRQRGFLKDAGHKGQYVLLGTSWFEFDDQKIQRASDGTANKTGYDELIDALNKLLAVPGQFPDIYELALAYRNALQLQFDNLKNAALTPRPKDKRYYYSLYHMLQNRLQDLETDIYSVQNPGKCVSILNNRRWWSLFVGGVGVKLLSEVDRGKLCVKFSAATHDDNNKREIRQQVREATHRLLDGGCRVIDAGRLGDFMTACQIEHDFTNIENLDRSARLFRDVDAALPHIGRTISPVIERTCSQHSYAANTL
jgi:hypothetical protein